MRNYFILFAVSTLFLSCKKKETPDNESITVSEVARIINETIKVAGGPVFKKSKITFDFRGKTYASYRNNAGIEMSRLTIDTAKGKIKDIVLPNGFKRLINDEIVTVPDSMAVRYSNSVNSVHYFAYLPQGLNDKAVNKELLGEVTIKNIPYYKIKITFDQEGGGVDFDDIFVYWINKENYKIDYLAYEFHVDGGGVRLREAYNERYIGNLRFVNYNNYKPIDASSNVKDMDKAFEENNLKLLSKIELENINVINSSN